MLAKLKVLYLKLGASSAGAVDDLLPVDTIEVSDILFS